MAGFDGITKCWFDRFAWNVPSMAIVEGVMCVAGIGVGLSVALSFFQPIATLSAEMLELEFRSLTNKGR